MPIWFLRVYATFSCWNPWKYYELNYKTDQIDDQTKLNSNNNELLTNRFGAINKRSICCPLFCAPKLRYSVVTNQMYFFFYYKFIILMGSIETKNSSIVIFFSTLRVKCFCPVYINIHLFVFFINVRFCLIKRKLI